MLFSSLEFLYLFLPLVLFFYFSCPLRWRNIVLLVFSLIFYGWGEPVYVFLMVFTITIDYVFGLLIEKNLDKKPKARRYLVAAVASNLLILGFFKYAGFIVSNLRLIPGLGGLEVPDISLPIGISFYTFQALSYVIDVYRGDTRAQHNIGYFGAYVTLFPQLIAGPIVRYRDIDDQLTHRAHSVAMAASGIRTFTAGLCKKVLLANPAGELWKYFSGLPEGELTVAGAWLGIVAYTFQIYFDFSGYSDMAIGLGKIFGFRFLENFTYPYISRSITEFWRRWHISLSTWFREYVYIPLGGNRAGAARTYFNLFVVWLLTGLWHGDNWNFVIWGLYYFLLLFIEKAFLGRLLERTPAFVRHIYTMFFVVVGWVIFVFDSTDGLTLGRGVGYLKTMFGMGGAGFSNSADIWDIARSALLISVMVFASLPLARRAFWRAYEKKGRRVSLASGALCIAALLVCTAYLVDSSFNPFLYFRF